MPNADVDVSSVLNRMMDRQKHRGPDGAARWWDEKARMGLCHTRLAVLDLTDAGRQPMSSEDGRFQIVYNGEIYNWMSLRKDLETQGVTFSTRTDTEVLLELYKVHGVDIVHHLRGMFAFVIADRQEKTLFGARDRVGKKPFVYAETNDGFAFASEIPAVRAMPGCETALNHDALAGMLLHNVRHIVDPHTVYSGIQRLQAGHAVLVREGRIERLWRYWNPQATVDDISPVGLRDRLEEAIALRMVADVPVGALLSGGVDSSAIVATMARQSADPIRTYAMGFDHSDEDLRRARTMARVLGCVHREFYFDAAHHWSLFHKLLEGYGEPVMLLPLIYAYQLCEAIRDDGVKVVMAGHGADELFYGYTGHVQTAQMSDIMRLAAPVARVGAEVMRRMSSVKELPVLLASPGQRKASFYRQREPVDWNTLFTPDARQRLWNVVADRLSFWGAISPGKALIDESNFCALMVENTHSITTSADLPAMLASVEMRAPFLDQCVMDFAFSTPFRRKVPLIAPLRRLKWILRQAVRDMIPHDILFAPKRGFGFGISQEDVLRGPWGTYGDELFAHPDDADGLFVVNALRDAWNEFRRHGTRGSNVVPKLFAIQYWLQSTRALS